MLRALGFTLSGIRFGLGADANPDALIGERRERLRPSANNSGMRPAGWGAEEED